MQRFIRVIMGLFIMLAILNPVIELTQHYKGEAQMPALSTSSPQSMIVQNQIKDTADKQAQVTAEIYKKQLAQQMKVMITALDGVADAKVTIDVNGADLNKGNHKIDKVEVYVTLGIQNQKGSIAKISIGESGKPAADLIIEAEGKIKKMITELYQVPKEKIEVKIMY